MKTEILEFIKMMAIKRSSIIVIIVLVLACIYVTRHPIHMPSFLQQKPSTPFGFVTEKPPGFLTQKPPAAVVPITDKVIKAVDNSLKDQVPSSMKQNISTRTDNVTSEKTKMMENGFTVEEVRRLEEGLADPVHPRLLQWLRTHWIYPPSAGPLNLTHPKRKHFSQMQQSVQVDEILHQKTNGFFVECGAWDGEVFSNSLFFERERNWTGLLIESLKGPFRGIQAKKRNAFSINACLSNKNTTGKIKFGLQGMTSGLAAEKFHTITYKKYEEVQCFTLYSLMKAINRTKIDLFSLDVEGAEIGILKTIPFSHLEIDLFLIEYAVHHGSGGGKRFEQIDRILKPQGYEVVKKTYQDVFYRKKRNT